MTKTQRLLSRVGAIVILAVIAYAVDKPVSHASTDRVEAIDGDTLLLNGKKVRLMGIDAPETRQICQTIDGKNYGCGKKATQHLRHLIKGGDVQCNALAKDQYDRELVVCKKGDIILNAKMVEDGWAVVYFNDRVSYRAEELHAQKNKLGMWEGSFQTPQAYKRDNR